MPAHSTRDALAEGLADAVGFFAGALAGWGLGRLLGINILASDQGAVPTLIGWGLLLGGCGAGKWASLRWRARRTALKE